MSNTRDSQTNSEQPVIYQIRLVGQLDSEWSSWFDGLTVTLEDNGKTLLSGPVRDQAALYGVLRKVRNLGLPLVSVNSAELNSDETISDKGNEK